MNKMLICDGGFRILPYKKGRNIRVNTLIFYTILIWFSAGPQALAQTSHPNILFLLADDMRPDAIRALGNPRIETPNIDRLVSNGVSFTRATTYPICVVSRAEILTGLHDWSDQAKNNEIPTWPETFRDAGYETWHVGKWHVSGRPSARGYTGVAGVFSGGGSTYWKEGQRDWKDFPITGYKGWVFQSNDGEIKYPEKGVGLTSDISAVFADSAISLIKGRHTQPWFCQVNFTAPHDPLIMPPGLEGKYKISDMKLPENYLPVHPFDYGNYSGRDEKLLIWPRTELAIKDLLRVYYQLSMAWIHKLDVFSQP